MVGCKACKRLPDLLQAECPRLVKIMLSYAYGLCLRTSHPIPGLVSASDNQFVDAEVFLGGVPTWAAASEAECPWYTSPAKNTNGIPTLQVWKLVYGEFYKVRYSDDTDFL